MKEFAELKREFITQILKDGTDRKYIERNIAQLQDVVEKDTQRILERLRVGGIKPNSEQFRTAQAYLSIREAALNEAITEVLKTFDAPFKRAEQSVIKKLIPHNNLFRALVLLIVIFLALKFIDWRNQIREDNAKKNFEEYFDSKFSQCGSSRSGSPRYFTKNPKLGVYVEFQNDRALQWVAPSKSIIWDSATITQWFKKTRACSIASGKCLQYFPKHYVYPEFVALQFEPSYIMSVNVSGSDEFFDQCVRPTCDEISAHSIGKEELSSDLLVGYRKLVELMPPGEREKEEALNKVYGEAYGAADEIIQKIFTRCDDCAPVSPGSTTPAKPSYFTKSKIEEKYEVTFDTFDIRKYVCDGWNVEEFVNLDKAIKLSPYIRNERNIDDDLEWTGNIVIKYDDFRRFQLMDSPCPAYPRQRSFYTGRGEISASLEKRKGKPWQFSKGWGGLSSDLLSTNSPPSLSEISRCFALPLAGKEPKDDGTRPLTRPLIRSPIPVIK